MKQVEWMTNEELLAEWTHWNEQQLDDESSAGRRKCELEMEKRRILPPRFLKSKK